MSTAQPMRSPRHSLGIYPTYEQAQHAVDFLSDQLFPVEHVSIIGRDLRSVEDVTGRLTVGRAALAGAGSGAWFGLLIGLIFLIVFPFAWIPVLAAVLLGALFGAIFGAVAHAATGGRRDFSSLQRWEAARYELLVDVEYADQAVRLLDGSPASGGRPDPSSPAGSPPGPTGRHADGSVPGDARGADRGEGGEPSVPPRTAR